MKETIELLRFALAAIWTELEKDDPNLSDCQDIADSALKITAGHAQPKDLTCHETGIASWTHYLQKKETSDA